LRQTIARAVHDIVPNFVAELFQSGYEITIHLVFLYRRYVLHGDDVRAHTFDQSCELIQQRPARATHGVVALCISRERLTGRASGEDADVRVAEKSPQFHRFRSRDVFFDESCAVVGFEWMAARRIDIDASDHRNPF